MWLLWKELREKKNKPVVCVQTFTNVFYSFFNLGFGNPKTDVCSTCQKFDQDIEAGGLAGEEGVHKKKLHELEAAKFYRKLNQSGLKRNVLCASFDLQQNMPLPRSNVGEAYYKRQLWLYNFGIIIHKTKVKKEATQSRKNVFLYSWLENEGGRGSNEICSAVFNFLRRIRKRCELRKYTNLHLYCDSCPGQNKNKTLLAALLQYVNSRLCVFKRVIVTFPVVGHSYLPADRVFGRIEKEFRKRSEIINPNGYYSILEKHGNLKRYNRDWYHYDYKTMADSLINSNNCGLRDTRRWMFEKNSKEVKLSESFDGNWKTFRILKKQVVNLGIRKPKLLPPQTHVTAEKKKDVEQLLKLVKGSKEDKKIYDDLLKTVTKGSKKKGVDDFETAKEKKSKK